MPELPEVETICRDLALAVKNDSIKSVDVLDSFNLREIKADDFSGILRDKTVIDVRRLGKMIDIALSDSYHLLIHLRMTGKITLCGKTCNTITHKKIIFNMRKAGEMILSDIRKFAVIYLKQGAEYKKISYITNLGVDPLSAAFSLTVLNSLMKKYGQKNIKNFLMDQKILSGIGNIYASEIMFRSGISPLRTIKSLRITETKKIFREIVKVLTEAVEARGTTFSDYRDSADKKGSFQKMLKVYDRENKKCLVCAGKIKKIKQGGRSTFFCDRCQK
ncbi:MAG: bifunctional DNA-formamidopyrimidine glycosylase/DNA-(apurinic or apyrimidinic site) lyase [Candidatus Margulisbacteria bacterium]|nr:bifunctional DNA-formamidopyrimidine glycosylase/DNA-(apurinic or apyrimidinic site) lyase [Candidatus Margulisiibacteriota bacterium]